MTELWLVRHGQTDWNVEKRYQGQTDIPLNETGLRQAQTLADCLDGQMFDAIYSSDLQRAWQTACILGVKTGLPVQADKRLREICQGDWEGKRLDEIAGQYAAAFHAGKTDPENHRPPNGESTGEVMTRTWAALQDIVASHPNGRVLLVSHGFSLAVIACRLQGISMKDIYDHIPDNAHPLVLTYSGSEN